MVWHRFESTNSHISISENSHKNGSIKIYHGRIVQYPVWLHSMEVPACAAHTLHRRAAVYLWCSGSLRRGRWILWWRTHINIQRTKCGDHNHNWLIHLPSMYRDPRFFRSNVCANSRSRCVANWMYASPNGRFGSNASVIKWMPSSPFKMWTPSKKSRISCFVVDHGKPRIRIKYG